MPLLQTVTSALLLHFSRLLLFRSRGSSSFFSKKSLKKAVFAITAGSRWFLQTFVFTVTTVTNKIKILFKSATGKSFSDVTVDLKNPCAVTLLLQTVTNCYTYCYTYCYKINNCISIGYKICNSWHPKNLYLRISHIEKWEQLLHQNISL